MGFLDNVAGWGAGAPGSYLGTENFGNSFGQHSLPWGVPGLEAYHGQQIFLTEALTREALKLIDDAVDNRQSFFLHMSHYAVHTPRAIDRRFEDNYPGLAGAELEYATMIEGVDRSLGDIMQHLADRGINNDTIIVFVSDNGGLNSRSTLDNAPLRGGKGTGYEGGLRVPLIVKAPGRTKPASVCSTNVTVDDLYPTVLALAGAEVPADYAGRLDGQDITPLFTGEGAFDESRPVYFHQPHQHEGAPFSAVVQRDWKLVFWHRAGTFSLYRLSDDIGEHRDLAGSMPNKTRHLASLLRRYLDEVDAQMPTYRDTGEEVTLPTTLCIGVGNGQRAKVDE